MPLANPDQTSSSSPAAPRFIAVGQNGLRLSSDNGTDWAESAIGKVGEIFRAICFGNGSWAAAGTYGGKNLFAVTKDGKKWEQTEKDGQYKRFVHGMGFGRETFVAVGGQPETVGASSPFALTSADGAAWSDYNDIGGKTILRRLAWGGEANGGKGLFVGVGDRGRRSASTDGRTWTDAPNTKAIDTLVNIAYGRVAGDMGRFVGVGLHGLRMSTVNGMEWTERLVGEEGEHLNSVVWTGDHFVAVGLGATYSSPDGLEWKRQPNQDAPLTVAFRHGADQKPIFVGLNWKGRISASADGIKWKQVHRAEHHLEAVG